MMITLDYVAETLQVPAEELWRQSLQAYVLRERRLAQLDIADIQDRYGVTSVDELTQRIEAGAIYSHPAWEDTIEWENLLAHLKRLDQLAPEVLCG
jgi:hypothetical protein